MNKIRTTTATLPISNRNHGDPLVGHTQRQLMVVVSSSVLHAPTWKYTYQLKGAYADADSPYGGVIRPSWGSVTDRGLSVSEMGNTTTYVCGGIQVSQLPAGFTPQPLHNGCVVWCEGARDEKGVFYWAILSPSQSIGGTCP